MRLPRGRGSRGASGRHSRTSLVGGAGQPEYGAGRPGYGNGQPEYGGRPDYGDGQPGYGGAEPGYGGGQPGYGGGQPGYGGQPRYGRPEYGGGPEYGGQPGYGGRPEYGGGPEYGGQPEYGGRPEYGGGPQYDGRPEHGGGPGYGGRPEYGGQPGYGGGQPGYGPQPGYGGRPDYGRAGPGGGRPGYDRGPGSPYPFTEGDPRAPRRRPVRRRGYRRGRGPLGWVATYPIRIVSALAIVAIGAVAAMAIGTSGLLRTATAPGAAGAGVGAAGAAADPNCTLIVPVNPLTPLGLATPYQLTATDPADGPCHEDDESQAAFVQGAIINPAGGQISVYDPLVIDAGTTAAVAPVLPAIPANAVVALWFGFNGTDLTLKGEDQIPSLFPALSPAAGVSDTVRSIPGSAGLTFRRDSTEARAALDAQESAPQPPGEAETADSSGSVGKGAGTAPAGSFAFPAASAVPDFFLQSDSCVAGEDNDGQFTSFTQVGACNAAAFFAAANAAIATGKLQVPAPGNSVDGQACLTSRSFAFVDADQSANVTTEYLTASGGRIAQDTTANKTSLAGAGTVVNQGDNGLLDEFVDPALGCSPWQAPNLADDGAPASALPLDELQAAAWAGRDGGGPEALVPLNDPVTLDRFGNYDEVKADTLRSIVDMAPLPAGQSPGAYCTELEQAQGSRLQQDVNLLFGAGSPQPDGADNLFTFLAMRLDQSFNKLGCGSLGVANEVSISVSKAGVAVAACFATPVAPITTGPGNPMANSRTCPATAGGS
jgi:hypothetical protein